MQDNSASRALPVPSRRPPSPEAQDFFLSRSCPTNVMDNPYQPPEASTPSSVGSNGSIHTFGIPPLNGEGQSRPSRPRHGNLIPSPTIPRRGQSTSRTRHSTMFPSFNRSPPEREWSVFEQRMENEGQMRTLGESTSEGTPLHRATDTFTRSESPVPGAPSPRRAALEDVHESDDASTAESDSESDVEDPSRFSTPTPVRKRRWYSKWKPPSLTPLQRKILKCAVAYFIGSLFTFNSTLSGLITSVISTGDESAPSQSGHMVATV